MVYKRIKSKQAGAYLLKHENNMKFYNTHDTKNKLYVNNANIFEKYKAENTASFTMCIIAVCTF